ncbi:hypothetical protein ACFVQB_03100 [Paenibacillus sp. NPDC057886]|uniref:hypothetical protein n=1 Tax=Paenibacillus sp. NPDC057886 TaxID=3346270 RepID=UPI0036AB3BF6
MKKKAKAFIFALSSVTVISALAATAYAGADKAPSKQQPSKETAVNALNSSTNVDVGTLNSPSDKSTNGVETKLEGKTITITPTEYTYDNSNKLTKSKSLSQAIEITPQAVINWPDQTIGYNTRLRLERSGGTMIVRKGVTARFTFSIKYRNSSYEAGFMDKNFNVLQVFADTKGAGGSFPYTPKEDVEGYFYIWNKAADDIEVEKISVDY